MLPGPNIPARPTIPPGYKPVLVVFEAEANLEGKFNRGGDPSMPLTLTLMDSTFQ